MKKIKRGFTLIELLVVVLIIGVLAAVALPQYQKTVAKARAVEFISIIDAAQKALNAYMLSGGEEKQFFVTDSVGNISLDKREELNIFIPISDKLAQEYFWVLEASPTEWSLGAAASSGHIDLAVSGNPFNGLCAGWDQEGLIICRTLAQHYPSFTCRDGTGDSSGEPPLCD